MIAFFSNYLFSQDQIMIKVLNSENGMPISNVSVYDDYQKLGETDEKGMFVLNEKKEITLRRSYFFDSKFEVTSVTNEVYLDSIKTIRFNEVVLKKHDDVNVLDKIYEVYKSRENYLSNFWYYNLETILKSDEEVFIDLNETVCRGKINKNNQRVLKVVSEKYDCNLYHSKKLSCTDNSYGDYLINELGEKYLLPHLILSKRSFFYFDEIHYFFNNHAKLKFHFEKMEGFYVLRYIHKNKHDNMQFNITLLVDRNTLNIVQFNKKLINNRKTDVKTFGLVNSFEISQTIHIKKYDEQVLFKKNETSGQYELVSESMYTDYTLLDAKKPIQFIYYYIHEQTVPFECDVEGMIEKQDLIKKIVR